MQYSTYGRDPGERFNKGRYRKHSKGRTSKLLTEYFPDLATQEMTSGYIQVTANKSVASFALVGMKSLSVVSAVPAQPSP